MLPSFDHWRFPHDAIPRPWSSVTIPPAPANPFLKHKVAAAARDGSCRITACVDACEVGHLVPLAAGHWFVSNNIERYCRLRSDHNAIDDENNVLVLRRDVHHLLDTRRLVLTAKQQQASEANPPPLPPPCQLVVHVLLPHGLAQLVPRYHNRLPQPITGVALPFLFARFAWTIFADENMPFFHDQHKDAVLLFDPATGRMVTERLQGNQVVGRASIFASFSRSRSISPKQRRQPPDETDHEDTTVDALCRGWGDDGSSAFADMDDGDEQRRGRSRKRRGVFAWRHEPVPDLTNDALSAASSTAVSERGEAMAPLAYADYPGKKLGSAGVATIYELT